MRDPLAARIIACVSDQREAMVRLLTELAHLESPSLVPETQLPVQSLLRRALEPIGYGWRHMPGRKTGGHLELSLRGHPVQEDTPIQLLLGHTDTVWPLGSIERMPVEVDWEKGVVRGPGVFDMKGGLVQIVFALRALAELGLEPAIAPVAFINSDEEIGSPESHCHIERLAKAARRALVVEPALGPEGRIKTTRRGVGGFKIRVVGKASHSGLDPEAGASAIEEMSHVIQTLHRLTDRERGIGVNVGTVRGGTRANVVAAECRARVDVRVSALGDARTVELAIRRLAPTTSGTRLEISGAVDRAPMEATPRNRALWKAVRDCGYTMGLDLSEGHSGGASDGNITSLHTATIDGLGPVGGGAHALHEFIVIDKLVERTVLLTLLLMLPDIGHATLPVGGKATLQTPP